MDISLEKTTPKERKAHGAHGEVTSIVTHQRDTDEKQETPLTPVKKTTF